MISKKDLFIISYFKKLISSKYRYSENFFETNKIGKRSKLLKVSLIFSFILSYFYLIKYVINFFLVDQKKIFKPEVLYIQRKSERTTIENTYNELNFYAKKNNIKIDIVSLEFQELFKNKKITLNSINNFNLILLKSYVYVFKSIFRDFQIISILNPPMNDIKTYIQIFLYQKSLQKLILIFF